MINNQQPFKYPLPVLSSLIAFTANMGFTVGPVSLSFFLGLLLIVIVYVSFPHYAIIRKDMRLLLLFSLFSIISLVISPVSIDASTIFVGFQIIYWFILANIFSNICNIAESGIFQKGIILAIIIYFLTFYFLSGNNDYFTENSASCVVVAIWPLGLSLFKNKLRILYVLFVVFSLYIIGSRTGILLVLVQIIAFLLVRKISAKKMVASLISIAFVFFLISLPKVRSTIAEIVFPEDVGMQTLIETPEAVFQLDKSWVQRRIQQEKSKQVMRKYPFWGIGPLNFSKYNIDINTSKVEDVDEVVLDAEMARSENRSSHNSYFQMFAENGILGTLIAVIILLKIMTKLYSGRDDSEIFVILMISALGLFTNLFMVSIFWGTSTWILLGIFSGYARNKISKFNRRSKTNTIVY